MNDQIEHSQDLSNCPACRTGTYATLLGTPAPAPEAAPAAEPEDTTTYFDKVKALLLMELGNHAETEWQLRREASMLQDNLDTAHLDMVEVLARAGEEETIHIAALLKRGRIAGHTFDTEDKRPCGCLFGTILLDHGEKNINDLGRGGLSELTQKYLGLDIRGSMQPAERLFMTINQGDKPSNNPFAQMVHGFITELEMSNPRPFKAARKRMAARAARLEKWLKKQRIARVR